MRELTVQQLHEIVGGRLRLATLAPPQGELARVGRAVTDSRQVHAGDVFWGLAGTRFDGAEFASEAYDRGASGVVVGRKYVQPAPGCWSLEVDDAVEALHKLAAWNRQSTSGRVVAVTGSVGKTTTRQMIHAVLSESFHGSASPKNFNNHVGVPLSMLAIEPDDDFAVLELAASAPGEIGRLAALAAPHIGVITRVGDAHLGGFGSLEAVAAAKLELLDHLQPGGWAVLCGDDERLRRLAAGRPKTVWFGRALDNHVVATHVESSQGRLRFSVDGTAMSVGVWGRHHLAGALAAVAVGRIFGLSDVEIARGLANFEAPPMRCQITTSRRRHDHRRHLQRQPNGHAGRLGAVARFRCARPADRRLRRHARVGFDGRRAASPAGRAGGDRLRRRPARGLRRAWSRRRGRRTGGRHVGGANRGLSQRGKICSRPGTRRWARGTWCWSKGRGSWAWRRSSRRWPQARPCNWPEFNHSLHEPYTCGSHRRCRVCGNSTLPSLLGRSNTLPESAVTGSTAPASASRWDSRLSAGAAS